MNDHNYSLKSILKGSSAAEEGESGIDLVSKVAPLVCDKSFSRSLTLQAFDALMNLDDNKDLSNFMRDSDIDLLWNLDKIQTAVREELTEEAVEAADIEDPAFQLPKAAVVDAQRLGEVKAKPLLFSEDEGGLK